MSCIPPEAMRCHQLGDAAVLEVRGAGWLLLARNTPHGGYSVPTAHYKLCECLGGNSSVPREVTCENEHSVTILSHVHLQQASMAWAT